MRGPMAGPAKAIHPAAWTEWIASAFGSASYGGRIVARALRNHDRNWRSSLKSSRCSYKSQDLHDLEVHDPAGATFKDLARITAGAAASLVIVGWIMVLALAILATG